MFYAWGHGVNSFVGVDMDRRNHLSIAPACFRAARPSVAQQQADNLQKGSCTNVVAGAVLGRPHVAPRESVPHRGSYKIKPDQPVTQAAGDRLI